MPPPDKKGYQICSFLNSASICILIKIWNWSVAELWGKNWDKVTKFAPFWILHLSAYLSRSETEVLQSYGARIEIRTAMHTWPARHPQQACLAPHCFHFFRSPPTISGTIMKVWSELLLHWLDSPRGLQPGACASDFWTCPQTPTFTQFICSKRFAIKNPNPLIYDNYCLNACNKNCRKELAKEIPEAKWGIDAFIMTPNPLH